MKKKSLLLSLIISLVFRISAQENFILYNMEFVPQHLDVNPSSIPYNSLNIGLPVLSSVYAGMGNSGFNLNDLISTSGSTNTLNIGSVIGNLKTNNFFSTNINVDLFSFGLKVKKNYFSFTLTDKANIWFRYPKALFNFLWLGNNAPGIVGVTQNFNFAFNASAYQEWGFGFAREISEKLSVGGKLKFLAGYDNASSEKSNGSITTDPITSYITASSNVNIHTSTKDTAHNISPANLLFNFNNPGLGMDLGATYKYSDRFTFSASLIDLGFISWNNSVTNYQSENPGASFTYTGIDINALNTSNTVNGNNFGQKLVDSLKKTFNIVNSNHSSYKTMLPAQMYLSGGYKLNEINNAGLLLYGQLIDGSLRPGFTLSLSSKVGKALTSMLTYSGFNSAYNIIGFGFSLNAGPVQIYAIADNLLALTIYNQYQTNNGAEFMLPAYSKFFNIRFGINLTLGRNTHDRDHDGVKDKNDDCPDVPGLKTLRGCPDRDGDGIADKDDLCPDIAGLPQFNGCPDTDGDGIPDKDDECPTEKGPLITKGCPDSDNDSIKDSEDECPNEAGPRSLKGCPDRDHDGVADKYDKCPDVPGPVENEGCPLIRLIITDSSGNQLGVVVRNKNKEFIYEKLLPDEGVKFKLEGEDIPQDTMVLIYSGKNKKLIKSKDGYYRFEKIAIPVIKPVAPPEEPRPKEKLVEVKLKEEEKEVLKTAFSNLEFENGKDVIKEQSYVSLSELAALLKKKPDWKLKIAGHTDNVGDANSNLQLSKKRAEAVKRFLVLSGLTENRMIVEFFGSAKPIADNKTPEGRSRNRRVEMTVVQ